MRVIKATFEIKECQLPFLTCTNYADYIYKKLKELSPELELIYWKEQDGSE